MSIFQISEGLKEKRDFILCYVAVYISECEKGKEDDAVSFFILLQS